VLHCTLNIAWTYSLRSAGISVIGLPKTTAGRHTVSVPSNVMPAPDDHLEAFVQPRRDAWLFQGHNGKPVSPRTIDRVWNAARSAVGRNGYRSRSFAAALGGSRHSFTRPYRPRPTANPSASTGPSWPNGPTSEPGHLMDSATAALPIGSTSTTIIVTTPPSEDRRSAVPATSQGTTPSSCPDPIRLCVRPRGRRGMPNSRPRRPSRTPGRAGVAARRGPTRGVDVCR